MRAVLELPAQTSRGKELDASWQESKALRRLRDPELEAQLDDYGPSHYDRMTRPITLGRWTELLALDSYRRVAQTNLTPDIWISTVWIGLDHNYTGGPPLIFETMVFGAEYLTEIFGRPHTARPDLDMARYTYESQAWTGHWRIATEWRLAVAAGIADATGGR